MKAVICKKYGPPDVLYLQEIDKPVPQKNEVLIKIHATSVTSSDTIVRGFKVPAILRFPMGLAIGFSKPRFILGMVLSGEIESVGKDVKIFKKGDNVYGINIKKFGAYAEYTCWPETSVMTFKPSNLSYEEASAIPYGGCLALSYLRKGNIQNGQKFLVYGASGSVGTSAVQLAKYFGAEITGVCSTANLELVRSLGASKVIDYTKEDFTSNGKLYDLIFNAVPFIHRTINLKYKKSLTADGKYISVTDGSPQIKKDDLIFLKNLIEEEKIKPVIDRCYKLEQMVEAHRYVDTGHKKGNVVISIQN